jgi:hypothetical protein
MLATRNNVILATEKIVDMGESARRKLLLTILGTNPTIVLRALDIGTPVKLFKVVLINHGVNKINVIKAFREIVGAGLAGLADSKMWAEGMSYMYNGNVLPSGVFGHLLTKEAADELLERVNRSLLGSGAKAEIVSEETEVKPLPLSWNNGY